MFNIGPFELLVILIVVLIVFGPNRLPEVARAMGKAVNEFKKATSSAQQVLNDVTRQISEADQQDSTASGTAELATLAENALKKETAEAESGDQEAEQSAETASTDQKAEQSVQVKTGAQPPAPEPDDTQAEAGGVKFRQL